MMEEREVTQEQAEKRIREQYQRPDEETAAREVLDAKCAELDVPGHEVEFDPDEAELCGAFREDALGDIRWTNACRSCARQKEKSFLYV